MKNNRLTILYALPFGFVIIRALADGETPLERLALLTIIVVLAMVMYPVSKRLYKPLTNWISINRKHCPKCDCNMSVNYQICPNCNIRQ